MSEDSLKRILDNQNTIIGQNYELIFSQVFHDTIKGSKWLPEDFAFSPGRGALGYPALYVLYRILDEFRPDSILETGMGQSTKMISLYNRYNKDCRHCVVEHDHDWIEFFCNHFSVPETTDILELPIIDAEMDVGGDGKTNVTTYVNFRKSLDGRRFDLICIDGPYGYRSPVYSRIDIMGILPQCLKDRFVILLDDCDRQGELNTFKLILSKLMGEGIECCYSVYNGEKGTGIIVSKDLEFMTTL